MKPPAKPFIVEIKSSRRLLKIQMKQRSHQIPADLVEAVTASDLDGNAEAGVGARSGVSRTELRSVEQSRREYESAN